MNEVLDPIGALKNNIESWELMGVNILKDEINDLYQNLAGFKRSTRAQEVFDCIYHGNTNQASELRETLTNSPRITVTFHENSDEVDIQGKESDSPVHFCAETDHIGVKFIYFGKEYSETLSTLDSYSRFNLAKSILGIFKRNMSLVSVSVGTSL